MKLNFCLLIFFFLHLSFLNSCNDFSTPGIKNAVDVNTENLPPVINSTVNDSIAKLFIFSDIPVIKNDTFNVTTIVKSKYHIGFPDFIKYEGKYYVSIRFSDGHIPKLFGDVVVISSPDLIHWTPEQIYIQKGYDLRDPKMFIDSTGLRLHFNSTTITPYGDKRNDYIAEFNKGTWKSAKLIRKSPADKSWLWRITYSDSTYYGMSYFFDVPLKLYESNDGFNFTSSISFTLDSIPTETTLRIYGDTIFSLTRVNRGNSILMEASKNDLSTWKKIFIPLVDFGGPNFLKYKQSLLLCGRYKSVTTLYKYDLYSNKLKQLIKFPSVADNGYPGMIIQDNKLFVVYFTGPKGVDYSINFAIVDLSKYEL